MATYQFSALASGQAINFNPSADVLNFDQAQWAAARVRFVAEGANVRIITEAFSGPTDVVLLNVSPLQFTTGNITFADGSRLLHGDNSTALNDNAGNSLAGTAGRDQLNGFGGVDTMNGGLGDDLYFVTTGDVLSDAGGRDTIVTEVSWTLGAGFEEVEIAGNGAVTIQGNDLANRIVGNDANNTINARGGSDTLEGRGGNDYFNMSMGSTTSFGNDFIVGGEGRDTVDFGGNAKSALVADLSQAFVHGGEANGGGASTILEVEDFIAGQFNDHVTGNDAANFLFGWRGDDTLIGAAGNDRLEGSDGNDVLRGGAGNDFLIGGAGADIHLFAEAPAAGNADNISGFASGTDKIWLDDAWHANIGAHGNFVAGDARFWAAAGATSGHDATDRVIYNTSNGNLYYDADGNGSGAAVLVATLNGAPTLAATDIAAMGDGAGVIAGTEGDDSLSGTDGNDRIEGRGGNDTLAGLDGNDHLLGGDGNDSLDGGGHDDLVEGGAGDDELFGGWGLDRLDGGEGNDTLHGGSDSTTMVGGLGDDTYHTHGSFSSDQDDFILIDAGGVDTVITSHVWQLADGFENLTLFGGIGESNTGYGNAADNLIVSASTTFDWISAFGGAGNDTLIGGRGTEDLHGEAGDDWLEWGSDFQEFNTLSGGAGNDRFVLRQTVDPSDALDDTIEDFASGADRLLFDNDAEDFGQLGAAGDFSAGDQRFHASADGVAHDASDRIIYDTDSGVLWYDADGSGAGAAVEIVRLNGAPTVAASDITVIGESTGGGEITGTEGDDSLVGTTGNDTIDGLAGNDTINGLAGDDVLAGGAGDDSLLGGDGNDTFRMGNLSAPGTDRFNGGGGIDTIDYSDAVSAVSADLSETGIRGGGEGGAGLGLHFGVENFIAGQFDDILVGDFADNRLEGRDGDDHFWSEGGNDTFIGGTGADVFHLASVAPVEQIADFASGADQISLMTLSMMAIGRGGTFADGDSRFHAAAGATQAHDRTDRVVYDTASGNLYYDWDGDGSAAAVLIATLQGAPTLVATDIFVDNDDDPGQAFNGTSGNDTLVGGEGQDTLNGFAGNDVLDGMGGDDTLSGGEGNDTLDGGEGSDLLEGGLGDDTYINPDEISDAGGVDTAVYRDGPAFIALPTMVENLVLAEGYDPDFGFWDFLLSGNELDNVIRIEAVVDQVLLVSGEGGNDTIIGGADWEWYFFDADDGDDLLDGGGSEFDLISFSGDAGAVVDFGAGTATNGSSSVSFINIEEVYGSNAGDRFVAGSASGGVHFVGQEGDDTLIGGAGDDTLDSAGHLNDQPNEAIENGNDLLIGGAGNDGLDGGGGSDTLNGGLGNDWMSGNDAHFNPSADTYVFDVEAGTANADFFDFYHQEDTLELHASAMPALGAGGRFAVDDVRFHAAAGATGGHDADDRVVYNTTTRELFYDADGGGAGAAQLIATLAAGSTIQAGDIVVAGSGTGGGQLINGTAGNDTLIGGDGNDTINGFAGNDSLNGGEDGADSLSGGEGNDTLNSVAQSHGDGKADTLDGGLGDDVYFVNDDGDVILADAGGLDTVHAMNGGWILGAGLENLDLDDTVGGAFTGVGNEVSNIIRGSSEGGELYGMGGNDTLIVRSAFNHSNLYGGDGNDSLIGGDRVDLLDGGAGIDTLNGGLGDDTYVVGAGDVIIADTGGIDLVRSEVSWSLGATSNLENLTLIGTAATTANGNQLDNVLTGNDANNSSINGRAGNDTMSGMGGNDTFDMSTGGTSTYGNDVIDGGSGTDAVDFGSNARTAVNVNLAAGTMSGGGDGGTGSATLTSIENAVGGNFNDVLTGNAAANFFFGGNGNDTLTGAGGNDRLQGGAGNDAFVFNAAPGSANSDVVVDFATGVDKLQMENSVMTAIGAAGNFASGDVRFWAAAGATSGHDANDRIVYNTSNGTLYYDADGSGAGAAQLIATLQGQAALAATDIAVI
ncbi:MAG TPA: M10 family metallopeptidase C-terminal domain-containing protein [Burkholderiales bacterium]